MTHPESIGELLTVLDGCQRGKANYVISSMQKDSENARLVISHLKAAAKATANLYAEVDFRD